MSNWHITQIITGNEARLTYDMLSSHFSSSAPMSYGDDGTFNGFLSWQMTNVYGAIPMGMLQNYAGNTIYFIVYNAVSATRNDIDKIFVFER